MLVLPLGLGTKLKRVPYATVLIGILWVVVFALDRSGDEIVTKLLRKVAQSGVRDEARELFVDYCKSRKGNEKRCERYSVLVWTGFPGRASLKDINDAKSDKKVLERLGAEHERAAKIRDELADCTASRKCFVYKDILWRFLERSHADPGPLAELGTFAPYVKALARYKRGLRDICRQYDCLVRSNINVESLLLAQLRHGGLMHLFGNLLLFIVFGVYVEQRTSRVVYLLMAIAGGTIGMGLHAAFFSDGETMALGGSANVSAVMGMFFVFFFRQRMAFRVWLPRRLYLGTTFRAPVVLCFPILFVLSDVTGGLDSGFSELSTAKVAHFAHLGGLVFGMAAAWLIARINRVPAPFIYESEIDEVRATLKSQDVNDVLARARSIVRYNPENVPAMCIACDHYLKWARGADPAEHAAAFESGQRFLLDHLQSICAVGVKQGELGPSCAVLAQLPMSMPFSAYLGRLGQMTALHLAEFALSHEQPLLALRLYDYFLTRFPLTRNAGVVLDTVEHLIVDLPVQPDTIEALEVFLKHHPDSQASGSIVAWVVNARVQLEKGA